MSDFEALTITIDGHVATLELCRPELLNRFDSILHKEFGRALQAIAEQRDVRATVLCAAGRAFSAGGDTKLMEAGMTDFASRLELIDEGRRLFKEVVDFPKPLIVALEGDVYGVGATVILGADAIVSHPQVRIADTHVRIGLTAGDGGVVAWPMNMPMVLAKRHLLTGDALTGEVAYRLGVVTDLVATREAVRDGAYALAQQMAALPPLAVQLTKRAFNASIAHRTAEAGDVGFYLEAMSLSSRDLREGIDSFKEKRPGVWTGN